MKERFFITGGLGYIGSVFAQEALKKGHDVCLYDSLIYEQDPTRIMGEIEIFKNPNSELTLVIGDNRNHELLKSSILKFKPTYVMHWGELSSVYACNHNPKFTENINYIASQGVINICAELSIPVFYNSTSSVYGTQKEQRLMNESDQIPTSTDYYCRFKLKMEDYIKEKISENPNFKIIVFRPATVFGLSPRFRIELLPNHFSYMAFSKKIIPVSGLNAYRAAIDIIELVNGYFKVIEKGKWNNLIYNIGHHNLNKQEFASFIQNVIPCKIKEIPDIGDLRNLQIDCSLFDKEFDFKPSLTFEQSVLKISNWFSKNIETIEENNYNELLNMPLDKFRQICSIL
jgi:nucleoside-diphosphate-sugar epimerase